MLYLMHVPLMLCIVILWWIRVYYEMSLIGSDQLIFLPTFVFPILQRHKSFCFLYATYSTSWVEISQWALNWLPAHNIGSMQFSIEGLNPIYIFMYLLCNISALLTCSYQKNWTYITYYIGTNFPILSSRIAVLSDFISLISIWYLELQWGTLETERLRQNIRPSMNTGYVFCWLFSICELCWYFWSSWHWHLFFQHESIYISARQYGRSHCSGVTETGRHAYRSKEWCYKPINAFFHAVWITRLNTLTKMWPEPSHTTSWLMIWEM